MLKIAWNEYYAHPLPAGHRFPMEKYNLLPEQLIYEGIISDDNIFSPQMLTEDNILSTHSRSYWDKLNKGTLDKSEERRMGFPYSKRLVERERYIVNGTIDCAVFALKYGMALNVAGGTHHAYTNKGEGFCLLNDIAIASNYLLNHQLTRKILVVDLDVHQGDGTAEIFADNQEVFTFSMHGKKNYPLKKQKSDLDLSLEDGTDDRTYLKLLQHHLPKLIDSVEPTFIFFQSGVDVLATDKLGRLSLSIQGCKERDRFVLERCKSNDIPVVASMGGGYSEKLSDIIEAHANTYRLAQDIFY